MLAEESRRFPARAFRSGWAQVLIKLDVPLTDFWHCVEARFPADSQAYEGPFNSS